MKKMFFIAVCFVALTACNNDKAVPNAEVASLKDSLQNIIAQKDSEINDIMGTFNEVEEGFRLINEAEGRISVAQAGEGADHKKRIKDNVQFISERMAQNRQLIDKLRGQLRVSSIKVDMLEKTIDGLVKQLEEKEKDLQKLREELDSKDIHIQELDETISNLNTDVASLKDEGEQKSQQISVQDKQLNTAWYVFGTKNELKEEGIIANDKVLQGNFNKNYFTKIDIRETKEVKLYSKSAKILTSHPAGSYNLIQDSNKQYILRITNPQIFWSTSKYLVVQVK